MFVVLLRIPRRVASFGGVELDLLLNTTESGEFRGY